MLTTKCLQCAYVKDNNETISCEKGYAGGCTEYSPISWVGGKYRPAKKIVELFPEHNTYVEVFGGAAHVLFKKRPSKVEVYNDINDSLVNFFTVIQNPYENVILSLMVENTLYARSIFDRCKTDKDCDRLTKAYNFYILNRFSFGAKMKEWGVAIKDRGPAHVFSNSPEKLLEAFWRIKNVQIENNSFDYVLKRYDTENTLFYLDPPYIFNENRSKIKSYEHEMTLEDHEQLVDCLLNIKGKVILSGYDNTIYDRLGWNKINMGQQAITVTKGNNDKRKKKTEYVWCNFDA